MPQEEPICYWLQLSFLQAPKDNTITKILADARRLQQQANGHFNPEKLFLQAQSSQTSNLANYTGPVKVVNIPGMSRLRGALPCLIICTWHCIRGCKSHCTLSTLLGFESLRHYIIVFPQHDLPPLLTLL